MRRYYVKACAAFFSDSVNNLVAVTNPIFINNTLHFGAVFRNESAHRGDYYSGYLVTRAKVASFIGKIEVIDDSEMPSIIEGATTGTIKTRRKVVDCIRASSEAAIDRKENEYYTACGTRFHITKSHIIVDRYMPKKGFSMLIVFDGKSSAELVFQEIR
ncbi:MAG TPA: hypothetical protein PK411_13395 [Mesotoga infera]|nr:hypothetical protein [Mesotoga infera]